MTPKLVSSKNRWIDLIYWELSHMLSRRLRWYVITYLSTYLLIKINMAPQSLIKQNAIRTARHGRSKRSAFNRNRTLIKNENSDKSN